MRSRCQPFRYESSPFVSKDPVVGQIQILCCPHCGVVLYGLSCQNCISHSRITSWEGKYFAPSNVGLDILGIEDVYWNRQIC